MSHPWLSRTDRLLLSVLLVGAALVALLAWLVEPPEKTGGVLREPSTFYNAAYGTKAAYEVLDRLGFAVTRLRRPIAAETLRGIGTLVILQPAPPREMSLAYEPPMEYQSYGLTALADWIEQGHALVVVPGGGRRRAGVADWFGLRPSAESGPGEEHAALTPGPSPASGRGEQPAAGATANAEAMLDRSDPLLAGIGALAAGGDWRFRSKSPLRGPLAKAAPQVFWRDHRGIVGLHATLGEGAVVALADSYPLSNLGIAQADNGLLLGNLARQLSRRYPGAIAFDEYQLGFPEQEWSSLAMVKLLAAGPWRWAIGQAMLAGLLGLYAGAVRFGSPRGILTARRRQHREFAEAAGRLLDEAGADALAARTLYRYYRERLCRIAALDPELEDLPYRRQLRAAVAERCGPEMLDAFDEAAAATDHPVGRQKLLAVFRKLHHLVEKLDHGT
jgi:hypothetical protein